MIKHIEITDFCGIKQLKLDVSKFNLFTGEPTQGKSSILNAIRWCIIGENKDSLIRNGANSTEVILHSDNGSRIERRMSRGSSAKVNIYTKDNKIAPKPQEILNKLYNPFLFKSTDILRMKPKELNEFISNALSSKIKVSDKMIELYLLDKIDLSKDPIGAIKDEYDILYERRAKVNKIVKEMSIKSSNVDLNITEDDIKRLENEFNELKIKLDKLKANKAQRDIIQQNIKIKESTEHNISELKKYIESLIESDKTADLPSINITITDVADKESELAKCTKEVSELKAKYESLNSLRKKLDSDKIVCPYSNNIKCETDFSDYKTTISEEIDTVVKNGKEKADLLDKLTNEVNNLKNAINKNSLLKSKTLELERYQSILDQINIVTVDEDVDDIKTVQELYNAKETELTRAKVSLETKNISNIDNVKEEQKNLNFKMERIKEFLDVEVPKMLKIDIADLKVDNTGIYFKDIPLDQLGDCMMMRICTAIIKSIYPNSSIFTIDGFERMGFDGMIKYINYFSSEDNQIQYFGTYVGEVKSGLKNCKIFNVKNFEVE